MIYAGLDVGSRTIKLVTLDSDRRESRLVETGANPPKGCQELLPPDNRYRHLVVETGTNPLKRCRELLAGISYERLVVTGYGRHLVGPAHGGEAVSEIKAFAVGARHLYPDCRSVIDIGGQDCKVIRLSPEGDVQKFEMNDRCAAGTGKFLEVMASTLEVTVSSLGDLAESATKQITLNSLCTVFAESEVVSLISRGEEPGAIALALHETIATRVATMGRRVGIGGKVVFAGGAALNRCLCKLLGQKLATELIVPDSPETVGALGAALLARHQAIQE